MSKQHCTAKMKGQPGQKMRRRTGVSFTVSAEERALVDKIVERALRLGASHVSDPMYRVAIARLNLTMDIVACHANGNPLRLSELLVADDFNFVHDVFGIQNHIDRETGKLLHHFEPRFSGRETHLDGGRALQETAGARLEGDAGQ